MLGVKLKEGKLPGVGRIAGVEAGAKLFVDKMGGEKTGVPGRHVGIPWHEEQQENENAAKCEHGTEPGTPIGNEKGGDKDNRKRPKRPMEPFAQSAKGEKNPEKK